jgi:gliding-associated putative ABC transporter substrate-binding component GldG
MAHSSKKLRTGGNAVLFSTLVIASLVAANLIGTRVFGRVDLTEDRIYTLSSASKDLVRKLPDRLIAKAYISTKDVPPQVAQVAKYLRDLLDEYKAASAGKFQWESVDPTGDPKKESEASAAGVRKLQMQQLSKEKVSIGSLFLGVSFSYGDKTEKLPQVTSVEGLEYEISSILKRLTVKKRKIAFTQGQGEPSQQQLQMVWGALGQNYDVQTVSLAGGQTPPKIADDVDALVVMGPKQAFSDGARKAIDEFLMQGKAAAFLVDGMAMETPRGQMPPEMQMPKIAKRNETGLEPLLSAYGFKINDDIVMDEQNARAPAVANGQLVLINQPYFPIATKLGKHDVTDKVRGVMFPLASSVDVTGAMKDLAAKSASGGGGSQLVALAQSTARSWRQTGFFMMDPTREIVPAADAVKGPFTFGYAFRGPLKSALAGAAGTAMSTPESGDKAPSGESRGPVRLVVIGDSDFASDEFLHGSREIAMLNGNFFLNIVDWLVQDEALVPVRSKGVTQRPLAFEESTPLKIKIVSMAGLPLCFILYGVLRWRLRQARSQRFGREGDPPAGGPPYREVPPTENQA